MSTFKYPWYPYISNILKATAKTTERERQAVEEALKAASPVTQDLVREVCITRSKTIRGAAADSFLSYNSAWIRIHDFKMDVARRLGLLEE